MKASPANNPEQQKDDQSVLRDQLAVFFDKVWEAVTREIEEYRSQDDEEESIEGVKGILSSAESMKGNSSNLRTKTLYKTQL